MVFYYKIITLKTHYRYKEQHQHHYPIFFFYYLILISWPSQIHIKLLLIQFFCTSIIPSLEFISICNFVLIWDYLILYLLFQKDNLWKKGHFNFVHHIVDISFKKHLLLTYFPHHHLSPLWPFHLHSSRAPFHNHHVVTHEFSIFFQSPFSQQPLHKQSYLPALNLWVYFYLAW